MQLLFSNSTPPEQRQGQFHLLNRHFFERFFYNDLISSSDDPQLTAANLMAVLAFPGMLSLYLIPKYYVNLAEAPARVRDLAVLGDRWLLLGLSMIVIGLLTLAEWDSVFPDTRDARLLGVLPIRPALIFAAQSWALVRFLSLFFAITNAWSIVFFPVAAVEHRAALLEGLRFFLSHLAGVLAGNFFVVATLIALQGFLIAILSRRWFERVSPWVQLSLMFVLFSALILIPGLSGWVSGELKSSPGPGDSYLSLLPPMWFAGLSATLNGDGNALLFHFARLAVWLTGLAVTLAGASYLLSYHKFVRRSLESPAPPLRRFESPLPRILERWWLKDAEERASFHFTIRTLARSRYHRLHLTAFAAVGFAVVLAGLFSTGLMNRPAAAPRPAQLALPFVPLFMLLAGMRSAFNRPAELGANWLFRLAASGRMEGYSAGTEKAVTLVAGVPLGLVTAVSWGVLWGWKTAALHLVFFFMAAWISARLVLFGFPKIPFTCTFVPARAHVIFLWALCLFAMFTYSSTLGSLEAWALGGVGRFLVVFGVAAAACVLPVAWFSRWRSARGPVFHEVDDPVVHRLNLEP